LAGLTTFAEAWRVAIPAALATFAASVAATRAVLGWLRHRQILDHPNERSSHSRPTPRGGGLAVTSVLAAVLIALRCRYPVLLEGLELGVGALGLMALSWWDDRKGLPALPRFAAHAAICALFLALTPPDWLVFQGWLPFWVDRALALLGWLWFVNLYNFMDGIDGITGVETACVGAGLAVVCALTGEVRLLPPAGVTAAAALGFLVWNWHPARIFLGDSGSIPLGFILGGLLVHLAARGQLAAALILPAYYVADASITLLWRLRDGETIWQPHRRHFYQRAVRGGQSHARVSLAILGGNVLLIGCACLAAMDHTAIATLSALAVVAGLLGLLTRWSGGLVR